MDSPLNSSSNPTPGSLAAGSKSAGLSSIGNYDIDIGALTGADTEPFSPLALLPIEKLHETMAAIALTSGTSRVSPVPASVAPDSSPRPSALNKQLYSTPIEPQESAGTTDTGLSQAQAADDTPMMNAGASISGSITKGFSDSDSRDPQLPPPSELSAVEEVRKQSPVCAVRSPNASSSRSVDVNVLVAYKLKTFIWVIWRSYCAVPVNVFLVILMTTMGTQLRRPRLVLNHFTMKMLSRSTVATS